MTSNICYYDYEVIISICICSLYRTFCHLLQLTQSYHYFFAICLSVHLSACQGYFCFSLSQKVTHAFFGTLLYELFANFKPLLWFQPLIFLQQKLQCQICFATKAFKMKGIKCINSRFYSQEACSDFFFFKMLKSVAAISGFYAWCINMAFTDGKFSFLLTVN